MSRKARAVLGLVLAGLLAVGCVISWLAARSPMVVAPVLEGEPETTLLVYRAPMAVLSLLLATAAGVLVVVSVATLRRRPPDQTPKTQTPRRSGS